MSRSTIFKALFFLAVFAAIYGFAHQRSVRATHTGFQGEPPGSSSLVSAENDPWSSGDLIKPDELAQRLSGNQKPVILQTGVVYLYRISHIPGSRYAGQAGTAEGLEKLKKEVTDIPRDNEIVYYCGCCPWKDCPNIRPAYKTLKEMGFKTVRVLDLPNNFNQDWVMKNLPVEKGGV